MTEKEDIEYVRGVIQAWRENKSEFNAEQTLYNAISYGRAHPDRELRKSIIQEWVMWELAHRAGDKLYDNYGAAIDAFLASRATAQEKGG